MEMMSIRNDKIDSITALRLAKLHFRGFHFVSNPKRLIDFALIFVGVKNRKAAKQILIDSKFYLNNERALHNQNLMTGDRLIFGRRCFFFC
jgi:hypothetical protein